MFNPYDWRVADAYYRERLENSKPQHAEHSYVPRKARVGTILGIGITIAAILIAGVILIR